MSLCVMIAMFTTACSLIESSGYLFIALNPGIEISFDSKGRVLDVKLLNEEAKAVLSGSDFKGDDREHTMKRIVNRIALAGYLSVDSPKCVNCDKNAVKTHIVKAKSLEPVIKGSVASALAVAYIMTQKYLMHLPLYRLEQDFKRQGVAINRQNMANWSIQVCEDLLRPVYDNLHRKLLEHDVLHSDDTGVQVLREPDKRPQKKEQNVALPHRRVQWDAHCFYEYQPNRNGEHPENFLEGWSGCCHADGYAGYHNLKGVTVVGCWAHVRRKFNDAYQIAKAPDSPAKIGLDFCDRLFALEREFADLTPDERFAQREKMSKPLAREFYAWAGAVCVPPNLAISRAITYLLRNH